MSTPLGLQHRLKLQHGLRLNGLLASPSGPRINLSNATVASSASAGTVVGVLSVAGGIGTYTYTLTSNPGSLFSISGSNLQVAGTLTPGSDPITIQANNGAGSIISRPFLITVTGGSGQALLANNSNPALLADNTNPALLTH